MSQPLKEDGEKTVCDGQQSYEDDVPLNDDALAVVFDQLDVRDLHHAAQVTPRWARLVRALFARRSFVDVEGEWAASGLEIDEVLAHHGPAVRAVLFGGEPTTSSCELGVHRRREITSDVVRQLAETFPQLRRLSIHRYSVSLTAIEKLHLLPATLEDLSLDSCLIEVYAAAESLAFRSLIRALQKFVNLKRFSLTGRGFCQGRYLMSAESFSALPEGLEELHVSAGGSLKLQSLDFLAKFHGLRSLTMAHSLIGDDDIKIISGKFAKTLHHLDVSFSPRVTDFSSLAQISGLRSLVLDGNREQVDDALLASLSIGCPDLERLSVECCARISTDGVVQIARFAKLQQLRLRNLSVVSDSTLDSLARGCRNLEQLDISGSAKKISSLSYDSLASMRSLRHLVANGIPVLSDARFQTRMRDANPDCKLTVDRPAVRLPPLTLPPLPPLPLPAAGTSTAVGA